MVTTNNKLPGYDFESHYFDCNGHKMHYIAEGDPDASPLIMVHGNPSWSYYFRNIISAFKNTHYCIAADHIGMGMSDKPDDAAYSHRIAQRIDDLETFIESLNLNKKITLMVHDWGGMIGSGFAVRHPERIERIVYCNTAAFSLPRTPQPASFPWQLRMSRNFIGSFLIRGMNAFCRYAITHCVTKKPFRPEIAAAFLAPYNSWANRRAVLRFVQDIPLSPSHPSWKTINDIETSLDTLKDIPKQFFWGCKDFVFTVPYLDHWMELFPDSEQHRYPESGHYIIEEECDDIISHMRVFLGSQTAVAELSTTKAV